AASAEAFKQLVELGYVSPPAANTQQTVDECVRELKYNLARDYRDANHCASAAALAQELWERWPKEHRFGSLFIDSLGPVGELARRREAIEELERRLQRYQAEAADELAKRAKADANTAAENKPGGPEDKRAQFEERQLRELARGRPLLIEWLKVTQAL